MGFEPDIIVTNPESPGALVVVEVKLHMDDLASAEESLKRYMLGMSCPVGLLVSLDSILIYRNRFTENSEKSIAEIGRFPTAGTFDVERAHAARAPLRSLELELEQAVQAWLEEMAAARAPIALSSDLKEALTEHVMPALTAGSIRRARPRASLKFA